MRYTLDTEFDGHGGSLISLALVPESLDPEDTFYVVVNDGYNFAHIQDSWVRDNVLPILYHRLPCNATYCTEFRVGTHLRSYLAKDNSPIIIISDSPVDVWRFCELLSSTEDYKWANVDIPKITFEIINIDCWPNNLEPYAVQHNAYWDALALWTKI